MANSAFSPQNAVRSLLFGVQAVSPQLAAQLAASIMFRTNHRRTDN